MNAHAALQNVTVKEMLKFWRTESKSFSATMNVSKKEKKTNNGRDKECFHGRISGEAMTER